MDTPTTLPLKMLAGNPPTHFYPLQEALAPYVHIINAGWFVMWCITALTLLVLLGREYAKYRRSRSV